MSTVTDITRMRKMEIMANRLPVSKEQARQMVKNITARETEIPTRESTIRDIMFDDPDMTREAAEFYADTYLRDEWE